MSHSDLQNAIKRVASGLDTQNANARSGHIASVGPDGTSAKVKVMPEGTLTGWLPIGHIGVGANSIISPPNIGDLVMIEAHEGDAENWVVTHRLFSTVGPPPNSPATGAAIKSGQLAVVMSDGSYLHFTNDGTIHTGATTLMHTGTLAVVGLITATEDITAGLGGADQVGLQTHTHTQGPDSHGDTEAPTRAPTAGT